MSKLYPPYIEGTIPAFSTNYTNGTVITVPFAMNGSVGRSEVKGFALKVKTVQSNEYFFTLNSTGYSEAFDEAYFKLSDAQVAKLNLGQFYKVQLAYISLDGTIGYYSTVGVTKFTSYPSITIGGLQTGAINQHQYSYIGYFSQQGYDSVPSLTASTYTKNKYYTLAVSTDDNDNIIESYTLSSSAYDGSQTYYVKKDTTEREYYYQFILYDKDGNVIQDSGQLLHNSDTDICSYESQDEYVFPSDLEENLSYYLVYKVITNNKMECSSYRYRIMSKQSIEPQIQATLTTELNFDNGYVNVYMVGIKDDDDQETAATGSFLVTRACDADDYKVWTEVSRFVLHGEHPSRFLWRDFTVEQGKTYIYSLQQYNANGLYSSRILSDALEVDFEDAFLYDGEKQLKIKYNPKVASFKSDILETKTDTIGSKYPFMFRNGSVNYKEFSISGLISYYMDEEHLFLTDEEMGLNTEFSNHHRPGTITNKSITSADEDYFVRNNLYDLQKTYKADEAVHALAKTSKHRTTNLVGYNISAERDFKLTVLDWLNNGEPKLFRSPGEGNYLVRLMNNSLSPEDKVNRMLHTFSSTAYEIADCSNDSLNEFGIISTSEPDTAQLKWKTVFVNEIDLNENILPSGTNAVTVRLENFLPGDTFTICDSYNLGDQSFTIGATGAYLIDTGLNINSLKITSAGLTTSSITYSYYSNAQVVFNTISDIDIGDVPARSFIGYNENIIDQIEDVKIKLLSFYYVQLLKRPIYKAFYNSSDNKIYTTSSYETLLDDTNSDVAALYAYTKLNVKVSPTSGKTIDAFGVEEKTVLKHNFIPNVYLKRNQTPDYVTIGDVQYYSYYSFVSTYDEDETYYVPMEYTFYYDLNSGQSYLDTGSYNQLQKMYLDEFNLTYGKTVYSTEARIDSSPIDLYDIEEYFIKGPIQFESIECDNGVIITVGYDTQIINYSFETDNSLVKKAKANYTNYAQWLTTEKRDEYNNSLEDTYNTKAAEARENIPSLYLIFIRALENAIDEWER